MKKICDRFSPLALFLALSLALPVPLAMADELSGMNIGNISKGDAANMVPDVRNICKAINSATSGDFATKGFMVVKDTCTALPPRRQRSADCQEDLGTTITGLTGEARQAKIDQLCLGGATLQGDAAVYCAIRTVAKGGQAKQYCQAYTDADKAETGVAITAALDTAAAGVCWAEALSMNSLITALNIAKSKLETSKKLYSLYHKGALCPTSECKLEFNVTLVMGPGSIFNKGLCGAAAMAAGVAELVQTGRMLLGNNHSSGNEKIDSDNNVQGRGNLGKTLEVIMSSGLSLAAIQLGVCYYAPKASICDSVNNIDFMRSSSGTNATNLAHLKNIASDQKNATGLAAESESGNASGPITLDPLPSARQLQEIEDTYASPTRNRATMTDAEKKVTRTNADLAAMPTDPATLAQSAQALQNVRAAFVARANLAEQAAIMFTALTSMRAIALVSAGTTKHRAKAILQSMFQGNGSGSTFGATNMTQTGTNIYSSTGGSTFTPTTAPSTSLAATAGTPEAILLPPGSPMANAASQIGSHIPQSQLQQAAAGGAAGMGNLVASTASALGAKETSAIQSAMTTAYANMPKDDGAGYSGGGAKLASKGGGDGAGGVDLKGLFGGGEKEEKTAAAADLGYRSPASEDIWHSQNPKGNNLFQIISDRYDTAQRKIGLTQ